MRRRIFEIIEKSEVDDRLSSLYDYFMIMIILISLFPLAFKQNNSIFMMMDKVAVFIFIVDYILRWMTADYKFEKKRISSFLKIFIYGNCGSIVNFAVIDHC